MNKPGDFLRGHVPTTIGERNALEQWFQDHYDYFVKDKRRKGCLHSIVVYDYNTGEIVFDSGFRTELTAYNNVSNANGFIAYFYNDRLLTIQHRRFI